MTTHIVSALMQKRAELAGEIERLAGQVAEIRVDLAHVDATLWLFDPSVRPADIQARTKRDRPYLHHGHFMRAIRDVLRKAETPLTARQIAARLIDGKAPEIQASRTPLDLTNRVRHALRRNPAGLRCEKREGDAAVWRVDDGEDGTQGC